MFTDVSERASVLFAFNPFALVEILELYTIFAQVVNEPHTLIFTNT